MTPSESSGRQLVIAPLATQDLREVAELHVQAFPGFFLSSLGTSVLREFYRAHLLSPTAHSLVARATDGALMGVVAGTTTPAGFYREMVARNPVRLAFTVALAVIRRPRALRRIIDGLRHGTPVPFDVERAALLSSICVDPSGRAHGTGTRLLYAWLATIKDSGHSERAYLTTDAFDNEAVIRWYEANGWQRLGLFERHDGRRMICYLRSIAEIPAS